MEESVGDSFGVKEQVVRKLLGRRDDAPKSLMIVENEQLSKYCTKRSRQLTATKKLQQEAKELHYQQRERVLRQLRDAIRVSEATIAKQPVYGSDLRERLTIRATRASAYCSVLGRLAIVTPSKDPKTASTELAVSERPFDILQSQSTTLQRSLPSLLTRSEGLRATLTRFAFVTPEATAPVLDLIIPPQTQSLIRNDPNYAFDGDFAHEARIRTTIAFPDSRLLVFDSGKLQRLVHLLRDLQARGSRSLIFSQMTLTLDILERFLNLLNLPYHRLDGSTPVERRQLYSAEFNKPDSKYQVMILSSRAGGVGLNLTGASSVIFYDLDWNPQMDKQCMDRAHRIGQVRDVEVYKMVSEKTVEENILRRANQKSLLDQTVIQEGNFTTDYDLSSAKQNDSDEVGAAIDRLFEGGEKAGISAIETIEDKEDVVAAQAARKEEQVEQEEFAENAKAGKEGEAQGSGEQTMKGHVDGWMVGWMEVCMRDGVVQGAVVSAAAKRDRHGRDPGHRAKRKR
ncbi:swr1 complex component [Oleoguttula sp. CCFEE 5521]